MNVGKILIRNFNKISTSFADLSMRTKLLLCFAILTTTLISSIGFITYSKTSEVINKQSVTYSVSTLKQVADRVEKLKREIMDISVNLVINPEIQNNNYDDLENNDYSGYLKKVDSIRSSLNTITTLKNEICSIYICVNDKRIFSLSPTSSEDETGFNQYAVFKSSISMITAPVWTGVHQNEFAMDKDKKVLTFSRSLYDKMSYDLFGALIINIPSKIIEEICKYASGLQGYHIFIVDKKGGTIFNSMGDAGDESVSRIYLPDILKGDLPFGTLSYKDDSYLVHYQASTDGQWYYILETPMNYISENSDKVRNYTVIILLIGFILSVITSLFVASYFTTPLRRMIKVIEILEKGNFELKTGIRNKSETGQLSSKFDHMVDEIKSLILKLDQEHSLKRREELNALQAQITPHFLYNTLATIKGLANVQKAESIVEITECLIDLLRISISNKEVFIPIREELELVKKYLILQRYRYGNKLDIKYDCSQSIMECLTVKMVLQPLVENALLHGLDLSEKQGLIIIRTCEAEEGIIMEIEDNGIGMDEERIEKILSGKENNKKRFSGIGVKNVDERIRMHFGEGYGLKYKSEQGNYTKAVITIPVVKDTFETGKL